MVLNSNVDPNDTQLNIGRGRPRRVRLYFHINRCLRPHVPFSKTPLPYLSSCKISTLILQKIPVTKNPNSLFIYNTTPIELPTNKNNPHFQHSSSTLTNPLI